MTSISRAAPLPLATSAVNGIPSMSDLSAINMESSYMPKSTSNSTSNKKKKKKRRGQNATASVNSSLNEDQHVNDNTASLEHYELSTNGSAHVHDNPSFVDEYASEDYEPDAETSKKSKKKKKKKSNANNNINNSNNSNTTMANGSNKKNDRIWNTNTNEERERIKDFWLSLGEEERRSLVKVEKEAVLRKMKEQQKHSCSCSVCGRKRTAIEKELEVLYDAYYEELEQYANHQQKYGPVPPPSLQSAYPNLGSHSPSALVKELQDDEDDEDDEDDDDDYSESDQPPELLNHDIPRDFFNFGNSLTVQGGILTVADDLLKNDGKKFIEMMEQLAERRMAREEEALAATEYDDDDDYDDEEDDEDYEDDEEDDEADSMSEEQRMEEGRRMFQIFAARMFEQRVLTAYREKVSQERQQKLLEELDEENRLREEREIKKAKEKEKRKDKKRQQKQAKEEERVRREAEKAAEEAAHRAEELRKAAEARQRREEQRLKKEAERKAQEEERTRKEEERRRRQQEEREREAERERKRKAREENERKKKEEQARKDREQKEQRERELRDKREKEEQERKEKLEAERKQREEQERLETLARQQQEKEMRDREVKEREARARKEALQREVYAKRLQVQQQQIQQQLQQQQQQQQQLQQQQQQQQQSLLHQYAQTQSPFVAAPLQAMPSGKQAPLYASPSHASPSGLHATTTFQIQKTPTPSRTGLPTAAPGSAIPPTSRPAAAPASASPVSPALNGLPSAPSSESLSQSDGQIPANSVPSRPSFVGDFTLGQQGSTAPSVSPVPLGLYGNTLGQNAGYRAFASPLSANSFSPMTQQARPQPHPPQSRQSFVGLDFNQGTQQASGLSSFPFGVPSRTSTTPIGLAPSSIGGAPGLSVPSSVSSVLSNTVVSEGVSPATVAATAMLDRRLSSSFDGVNNVGMSAINGPTPTSPKSKPIQRPHPIQRPPSNTSRSDEPHSSSSSANDDQNLVSNPHVMGSRALLDEDDIPFYQPSARRAAPRAPGESPSIGSNGGAIAATLPIGLGASRPLFGQSNLFPDPFSATKKQSESSPLFENTWNIGGLGLGGSNVPATPWLSGWTDGASSNKKP
ncbi:salt tolerance down-regulator-domain-containing protein [Lipomyces starkeyi]